MAVRVDAAASTVITSGATEPSPLVPVLVVSGWLGAGKTTLVEHLLRTTTSKRIGILVNDMASINVDAATLSRVVHSREEMVEFSNGCICCTLRGDFVTQLADMAAALPPFDALVVESSGISEPQQVAEAFDLGAVGVPDEDPDDLGIQDHGDDPDAVALAAAAQKLAQHARLDCALTVVDAVNFHRDMQRSTDLLADRGQAAGPEDDRRVSELLVQQVEFADVLVINKVDLVDDETVEVLRGLLRALNPTARVLVTTRSAVDANDLLDCKRFDLVKARMSAGWLQSLSGKQLPESEEYGITHTVFRARRPFHPARLCALLLGEERSASVVAWESIISEEFSAGHPLQGVLRAKGGLWMATEFGHTAGMVVAQAGRVWSFSPGARWLATPSGDEDNKTCGAYDAAMWDAEEGVGDRMTEIVLIGVHIDKELIHSALHSAVLAEEEWAVYRNAIAAAQDTEGTSFGAAYPAPLLEIRAASWTGPWHDPGPLGNDDHRDGGSSEI